MISEASDFLDESRALHALVAPLPAEAYDRPTGFKDWTSSEILRHLHFWNMAAGESLNTPEAFQARLAGLTSGLGSGRLLRDLEAEALGGLSGPALAAIYVEFARGLSGEFAQADPARRLPWGGPSMSARSSISARLMETWSHAQAIYDLLGIERRNEDRIRSIVVLGVNTCGWTFSNRGLAPPDPKIRVQLTAPSGAVWSFNSEGEDLVSGLAEEFCQVVTQTRNVADTGLTAVGERARYWMENAQCFAGPPHPPPPPGTRFTARARVS